MQADHVDTLSIIGTIPDDMVSEILQFIPRKRMDRVHCKMICKRFERLCYPIFKPVFGSSNNVETLLESNDRNPKPITFGPDLQLWLVPDDLSWSIMHTKMECFNFILDYPKLVFKNEHLTTAIRSNQSNMFDMLVKSKKVDINSETDNPLWVCIAKTRPQFGLILMNDDRICATQSNRYIMVHISQSIIADNNSDMDTILHRQLALKIVQSRKFDPVLGGEHLCITAIILHDNPLFLAILADKRFTAHLTDYNILLMAMHHRRVDMVDHLLEIPVIVRGIREGTRQDLIYAAVDSEEQEIIDMIIKAYGRYSLHDAMVHACERDLTRILLNLLHRPDFDPKDFRYDCFRRAIIKCALKVLEILVADERLNVFQKDPDCMDIVQLAITRPGDIVPQMFIQHPNFDPLCVKPTLIIQWAEAGKTHTLRHIIRHGKIDLRLASDKLIGVFIDGDGEIDDDEDAQIIYDLFKHPLIVLGKKINRFLSFFINREDIDSVKKAVKMPWISPLMCEILIEWICAKPYSNELKNIILDMVASCPDNTKMISECLDEHEDWKDQLMDEKPIRDMMLQDYHSNADGSKKRQSKLPDYILFKKPKHS